MISPTPPVKRWKLVGGELCLDFVNTLEWHASPSPQERLTDYEKLLSWSRFAGILDDSEIERLRNEASRHPASSKAALDKAITVREALYRIFLAIIGGQEPDASDIETVNSNLSDSLTHLQIVPVSEGYSWRWRRDRDALDMMLWPVMQSAAELLTSARIDRIGQCEDDRGCGWLFLDTSKNRSRRWCDMKICGNRAKAHRHYKQHHYPIQKTG